MKVWQLIALLEGLNSMADVFVDTANGLRMGYGVICSDEAPEERVCITYVGGKVYDEGFA